VTGGEMVFRKSKQNATFTNGGVPYDNQFDQMVVLLLASSGIHFFFLIIQTKK
jgi:hypothetical protein